MNCNLKILSSKTVKGICDSLNQLMILPADNGLLRDWRGLAELYGVDAYYVEKEPNPAAKLHDLILQQDECKSSIQQFLIHLEAIDRFDIIDDHKALIDKDVEEYSTVDSEMKSHLPINIQESYDAMVLYADQDEDFAYNIVDRMEKNYNFKIFVKERNLKAGDKEVQKILTVIANCSNKLIVVLSPHFLKSPTNEFFLDYAQTIAIEQRMRKIIPCKLTHCELPPQLYGLHTLTYTNRSHWGSFWQKLANSINPTACFQEASPLNSAVNIAKENNKTPSCTSIDQWTPVKSTTAEVSNSITNNNAAPIKNAHPIATTSTSTIATANDKCALTPTTEKRKNKVSSLFKKMLPKKGKSGKKSKKKLALAAE